MSNEEIDAAGLHRIENVFFWRGVKAWACILLPNIELKCDADLKIYAQHQVCCGCSPWRA